MNWWQYLLAGLAGVILWTLTAIPAALILGKMIRYRDQGGPDQ